MKIFFICLAALVLIVSVLLFSPVKLMIFASASGDVGVKIKYLFFGFSPKKDKTEKETKTDDEENTPFLSRVKSSAGKIKKAFSLLGSVLKKCRLDKLFIRAIITDDDAASAAIEYGVVCSVLYPLLSFIKASCNTKKSAISTDIRCDYNIEKPIFEFSAVLSLKVIFALFVLLKYTAQEDKKNEKK